MEKTVDKFFDELFDDKQSTVAYAASIIAFAITILGAIFLFGYISYSIGIHPLISALTLSVGYIFIRFVIWHRYHMTKQETTLRNRMAKTTDDDMSSYNHR